MSTFKQIVESMARTLFVNAYADHCEDGEYNEGNGGPCEGCALWGHNDGHPQPGGGQDWVDFAPETPPEALDAANLLAALITGRNGTKLESLLERAVKADGNPEVNDKYLEDFGHYLAMQALGHGVSWTDDHAEFGYKSPRFEFNPYL
jgi:hypothetical protein